MAGIFPVNGLTPGVSNTGVALDVAPVVGCAALYYNEVCAQKVDPAQLNALISEIVSVINACDTQTYDCTRRDNLLRAIECVLCQGILQLITGAPVATTPLCPPLALDVATCTLYAHNGTAWCAIGGGSSGSICDLPVLTQTQVDAAAVVNLAACVDGVPSLIPAASGCLVKRVRKMEWVANAMPTALTYYDVHSPVTPIGSGAYNRRIDLGDARGSILSVSKNGISFGISADGGVTVYGLHDSTYGTTADYQGNGKSSSTTVYIGCDGNVSSSHNWFGWSHPSPGYESRWNSDIYYWSIPGGSTSSNWKIYSMFSADLLPVVTMID